MSGFLPNDMTGRLLAMVIYAIPGAALYVILMGRRLMFIRRTRVKLVSAAIMFLVAVIIPAVGGFWLGPSLWWAIPIAVSVGIVVGELCQADRRRRHRGMPTVRSACRRRSFITSELDTIRYRWECPGWTGPAFRIMHLTDLHVGPDLSSEHIDSLHTSVAETQPDLLFMTGDFVTRRGDEASLGGVLGPLSAPLGRFAILGNHDYWADADRIREALRAQNVELLHNGFRTVAVAPGKDILVCGCEDPWGVTPWSPPARLGALPSFVLTHTADNMYALSRAGATAVFAGHYHGGQIRLPPWGAVVLPSVYGRRFTHGHYVVQGADLFVSAGVGVARPPFRINCPPDCLVVDVRAPSGNPESERSDTHEADRDSKTGTL